MKTISEYNKFNAGLNDYLREVICICPKCGGAAKISAESKYTLPWEPYCIKFICLNCPQRESWPSSTWKSDFINYNPSNGYEPYFGYQLYLQESVCQNNLIVFNRKHAEDLAEYIKAEHRPSPKNTKWSMVNRLPKWMKLAKNRTSVLKALSLIQVKIEDLE